MASEKTHLFSFSDEKAQQLSGSIFSSGFIATLFGARIYERKNEFRGDLLLSWEVLLCLPVVEYEFFAGEMMWQTGGRNSEQLMGFYTFMQKSGEVRSMLCGWCAARNNWQWATTRMADEWRFQVCGKSIIFLPLVSSKCMAAWQYAVLNLEIFVKILSVFFGH